MPDRARAGAAIGLDAAGRETVVYASLVAWVGCHVDAYEQAKWFGDEMALKGDARWVDRGRFTTESLFLLRHLGAGEPLHRRVAMVPSFFADGRQAAGSMIDTHWRASDDLMERLGLEQAVRETVAQSFERWDGRGVPAGLAGAQILPTARVVNLADVVAAYHRAAGVEARGRGRPRTGRVPVRPGAGRGVRRRGEEIFDEVEAAEPWAVVAAGRTPRRPLAGEELDAALEALPTSSTSSRRSRSATRAGWRGWSRRRRAPTGWARRRRSWRSGRRSSTTSAGSASRTRSGTSPARSPGGAGAGADARLPGRAHALLLPRPGAAGGGRGPAPRAPRRQRLPARARRR